MKRNWLIVTFAVTLISASLAQANGSEPFNQTNPAETGPRWQAEMEKSFEALERGLRKYGRDLEKLPERKEYRQMKSRLRQWASEMEKTGEEVRDKIESQWLPKVRRELEALEEWLRERTQENQDGIREV